MKDSKKSKFEIAVIKNVVGKRKEKGLSQSDLAIMLQLTRGFIGQVESPSNPSTYSLNQLNLLAYKFDCSLHDFIPSNPIRENNWGM